MESPCRCNRIRYSKQLLAVFAPLSAIRIILLKVNAPSCDGAFTLVELRGIAPRSER